MFVGRGTSILVAQSIALSCHNIGGDGFARVVVVVVVGSYLLSAHIIDSVAAVACKAGSATEPVG